MPRVSAIIPTFNRREMVMRAVTSALHQSHPVHEVIVIDDASTDGTAALFEGTSDQRIRFVRLPENRGGAVARNTGIDLATGGWIAFLDSDDEWLPEKLEQQLCAARGRTRDLLLCSNARLVLGVGRALKLSRYNTGFALFLRLRPIVRGVLSLLKMNATKSKYQFLAAC
jgi:glycosyltransferase involved in cell wall biosynthesis